MQERIRRNFKWAKSDVALRKESQETFLGGKGETYGRQSH